MPEPSPAGGEVQLLVLIARTEESFDPVVTALLDAGITGATVLESRGIGAIIRSEMPIFAGLAALLPQATGSRVILSIAQPERIAALMRYLDQLPRERRPIGVTLPARQVLGLEP
jgi:nitrogen regulatory protein P-II 1